MGVQITVKDVDEPTFHELKAYAVKHKMTVGTALTMAMHTLMTSLKKRKGKLSDVESFVGGAGTERLSEQMDEVLYA